MKIYLVLAVSLAIHSFVAASPGDSVSTETEYRTLQGLRQRFRDQFPIGTPVKHVQKILPTMGLKMKCSYGIDINNPPAIALTFPGGSLNGLKDYEDPVLMIEFDENGKVKAVQAEISTRH